MNDVQMIFKQVGDLVELLKKEEAVNKGLVDAGTAVFWRNGEGAANLREKIFTRMTFNPFKKYGFSQIEDWTWGNKEILFSWTQGIQIRVKRAYEMSEHIVQVLKSLGFDGTPGAWFFKTGDQEEAWNQVKNELLNGELSKYGWKKYEPRDAFVQGEDTYVDESGFIIITGNSEKANQTRNRYHIFLGSLLFKEGNNFSYGAEENGVEVRTCAE